MKRPLSGKIKEFQGEEKLQEILVNLQGKKNDLQDLKQNLSQERAILRQQIQRLLQIIEGLLDEIDQVGVADAECEEQKNALRARVEALQNENRGLTRQINELQQTITALRAEIAGLQQTIAGKDRRIQELQDQLRNVPSPIDPGPLNSRIAQLTRQLEAMQNERDAVIIEKEAALRDVRRLTEEIAEVRRQLAEARAEREAAIEVSDDLQRQNATLTEQVEDLQQQLAGVKGGDEVLRRELGECQAELRQLQDKMLVVEQGLDEILRFKYDEFDPAVDALSEDDELEGILQEMRRLETFQARLPETSKQLALDFIAGITELAGLVGREKVPKRKEGKKRRKQGIRGVRRKQGIKVAVPPLPEDLPEEIEEQEGGDISIAFEKIGGGWNEISLRDFENLIRIMKRVIDEQQIEEDQEACETIDNLFASKELEEFSGVNELMYKSGRAKIEVQIMRWLGVMGWILQQNDIDIASRAEGATKYQFKTTANEVCPRLVQAIKAYAELLEQHARGAVEIKYPAVGKTRKIVGQRHEIRRR